jgi:hypothetical protein
MLQGASSLNQDRSLLRILSSCTAYYAFGTHTRLKDDSRQQADQQLIFRHCWGPLPLAALWHVLALPCSSFKCTAPELQIAACLSLERGAALQRVPIHSPFVRCSQRVHHLEVLLVGPTRI